MATEYSLMEQDCIIKEVHAAKDAIAREAHYDLHTLFEQLRVIEEQNRDRVFFPVPRSAPRTSENT